MTEWYDVIGDGRERCLLDCVIEVILGLNLGALDRGDDAFERLIDKIVVDWHEGFIADTGFTLDDLASLSYRLKQLTSEKRENLLRYYRLACEPDLE